MTTVLTLEAKVHALATLVEALLNHLKALARPDTIDDLLFLADAAKSISHTLVTQVPATEPVPQEAIENILAVELLAGVATAGVLVDVVWAVALFPALRNLGLSAPLRVRPVTLLRIRARATALGYPLADKLVAGLVQQPMSVTREV